MSKTNQEGTDLAIHDPGKSQRAIQEAHSLVNNGANHEATGQS